MTTTAKWRAGNQVRRTLYKDNVLVGLVDTPELAKELLDAVASPPPKEGPTSLEIQRDSASTEADILRKALEHTHSMLLRTQPGQLSLAHSIGAASSLAVVSDALKKTEGMKRVRDLAKQDRDQPKTIREQVTEFHVSMDQPIVHTPTVPFQERVRHRLRLITEEYFELMESTVMNEDYTARAEAQSVFNAAKDIVARGIHNFRQAVYLPEFADALADLDYVIEGTRLEFGIPGDAVAAEVHRANMSKMGPDGKPILDGFGKVRKPPGFTPPNVHAVLRKYGWAEIERESE